MTELVDREPVVHPVEHPQERQDAVGEGAVYGRRGAFRLVPLFDGGAVHAGDALNAHIEDSRTGTRHWAQAVARA